MNKTNFGKAVSVGAAVLLAAPLAAGPLNWDSARPMIGPMIGPMVGMATWYGAEFHGQSTASGEMFDMFLLTAAHRDFPLGVYVRVTNLRNRKTVVVRINDRGPAPPSNIIDLSWGAASRLGMTQRGRTLVRLEHLSGGLGGVSGKWAGN